MMNLGEMMGKVCGKFHQEASYCCFFVYDFVNRFVLCKLFLYFAAAAGYERDLILNSLQSFVQVFFCSVFEYMHVSVHIYKHLALYFFCLVCFCKVLSPPFILTLLDHVVLVSSASTTNTREIKNRFFFRLERGLATRLHKNCQYKTKEQIFLGFFTFL